MISIRLFKLPLALLFALSAVRITSAQEYDPSDPTEPTEPSDTTEPTEFTRYHPARAVFSRYEARLLRDTDAVTLTPLQFEKKIANAWLKGRSDAMKDLAKNATVTGVGLNIDEILMKNEENKLQMTPNEIENQVAFVYQLGGLHALNNAIKVSGRDTELPEMREATPTERRMMRYRQNQTVRQMLRGMKVGIRPKFGMKTKFRIRPIQLRLNPLREHEEANSNDISELSAEPIESSADRAESNENEEELFTDSANVENEEFDIDQGGVAPPPVGGPCSVRFTCQYCSSPRGRCCPECIGWFKRHCRRTISSRGREY